jgi:anti-sigma28 factor (negative regulator of flagellin synthesis)
MKRTNPGRDAVRPILSSEAYSSVHLAALASRKAKLRAQKVQRIKKQIEEGTYDVSAADIIRGIARGIARSEISWLLNLDYARLPEMR